jgi:hypothetical protein
MSAFINFVRSQFPDAELPAEGWDQAWAGYIASAIHRDVVYGGGLNMLAQVQSTRKALDGTKYEDDRAITAATFLHKIGEEKRLNKATQDFLAEQRQTNPNYDIWGALYDYFGQPETMNPAILRALEIVNEIKIFDKAVDGYEVAKIAELGDEAGKNAAQAFQVRFLSGKMTDDDKKFPPSALGGELSADARVVLIAEKIANFETSRENPNTKKPPEWHRNYTTTRKAVVDAASTEIDPLLLDKANNLVLQLLAKYPENPGNSGGGGAAPPKDVRFYHNAKDVMSR